MTKPRDDKSKYPTFAEVKRAALQAIDRVLLHWLPGGKRVDGGKEYTAANPTRADKHAGSLKVNLATGTWSDFATGDRGGDLIDLVRYLDISDAFLVDGKVPKDIMPDGLHPNEKGYEVWAKAISPVLKEMMEEP